MPTNYVWPAVRISALYALFACMWILFSDRALGFFVTDPAMYAAMQTWKGWLFVLVTAGLLYLLMRHELRAREESHEKLEEALGLRREQFRELRHRLKNNLQTAMGLVELMGAQFDDENVRRHVTECVTRIRAMAVVHDYLDREKDGGRIDLKGYLEQIGRELLHAHGAKRKGIAFFMKGDNVDMSLDRAVNLGIIVTELVTNALKHAFAGGGEGAVSLELTTESERLSVVVRDNGEGMPREVDPATAETMGLTIVSGLAQQLGASLEIERGQGTLVRLALGVSA